MKKTKTVSKEQQLLSVALGLQQMNRGFLDVCCGLSALVGAKRQAKCAEWLDSFRLGAFRSFVVVVCSCAGLDPALFGFGR